MRFRIHWGRQNRQLECLWKETKIGDILPWEDGVNEAERLLAISKANRDVTQQSRDDGEQEMIKKL